MNASDSDLLRQFARDGSEAAFAELVRRHVDLVFSAALRQVDPDVQAAEDVTQVVFTDLARKAGKLGHLASLAGWLYGSTRFEAMQHHRTKFRRIARETAAHAMSQMLATATPEPDWNRLQPVLDEAMCDLTDDDREAVLLRYFEKHPLAEVGARLGLSENTARMRVDRALDKLHAALGKRGITSTAAALGTVLGTNAVASASAKLVERVNRAGSSAWQRKRPVLAGGGVGWLIPVTIALLLGITGLMCMNRQDWFGAKSDSDSAQLTANTTPSKTDSGTSTNRPTDSPTTDHSIAGSSDDTDTTGQPPLELVLKILTKDTGQPVPNVEVRSSSLVHVKEEIDMTLTTRAGDARIKLRSRLTRLSIATQVEGFAGMVVQWHPEKGDAIPTNYVLRLERGVLLGGTVVGPDDKPISGATLDFSVYPPDPRTKSGESLEFQAFHTETDGNGRWKSQRIAESMIERTVIAASAPNLSRIFFNLGPVPEDVALLRSQNHVFKLARGGILRGIVVNEAGKPVPGAKLVLIGGIQDTEKTSSSEGTFEFSHIRPGLAILLGAKAEGYAPKITEILGINPKEPARVVLSESAMLRIRLVNQDGEPVTDAVVSQTVNYSASEFPPMLDQKRPDSEGRIVWTNAPSETQITIYSKKYLGETAMPAVAIRGEQEIVLVRPPVIRGRVTDARTGRLLPKFHVALGWETRHFLTPESSIEVSQIDRFHLDFTNGVFRHELAERLLLGADRMLGFMVQFEAEGYQKHVSRPIGYHEGEVTLDVTLEPSADIEVTILDPSDRPAAGAEMALPRPGARFTLRTGHLILANYTPERSVLKADIHGKLKIARQSDLDRIIVAHPSGFLDTRLAELKNGPVLRLQPWGRIAGSVKTASNDSACTVAVQPQRGVRNDFDYEIGATTDASGRFEISQLPYGDVVVQQKVPEIGHPIPGSTTVLRSTGASVTPGETTQVHFGGDYRIIGRLRMPPGLVIPAGTVWRGHLGTPFPQPPVGMALDGRDYFRWLNSPEVTQVTRNAEHLPMRIDAEGRFFIEGAKARSYQLVVNVTAPAAGTTPPSVVAGAHLEIRIPEDQASSEIDLGDVLAEAIGR